MFDWAYIPLLVRRGGCAVKKSREATLVRADGVVAHKQMFQNALRSVTRERPPRPRLFGTGPFFCWRVHPSSRGGECAHVNSLVILSTSQHVLRLFSTATR